MNIEKHSIINNIIYLLKMVYKHYKIVFVFILLEMACNGILPLFGIYLPKLAVQLVLEKQTLNHTLWVLGAFSICYIIVQCVNSIAAYGKYPFQNGMRNVYNRLLFFKALDCDYSVMETKEGQTLYQKAQSAVRNGDDSATSVILNSVVSLISGFITFVFIFGIIAKLNILIVALLIFLTALSYLINRTAQHFAEKKRETDADLHKKSNYVESAMSDISGAKDIRIYNLSQMFLNIRDELLEKMICVKTEIQNRYFAANTLNLIIAAIRDGVAYVYCIWQVISGEIAVSDFVLFMAAIASFSGWLSTIVDNINVINRENVRLNDLRTFHECTNKLDPKEPLSISNISSSIDIEFKNVSFRYTDDTPNILEALSFHIKANEKVALVGINGAGKTTIVKLLCGFYQASDGEILINGYNINAFKRTDLYSLFSAVFQDICILPITVGENISFKKTDKETEEKILQCLEVAGLKDEIEKYSKKLNTSMLKVINDDGIILSGGQQQKLLLARALYKNAPILILDEPTAALDPIAESEVYEKFNELTENKTAIYISHRLASTRFCDRILMLKDGKITESGEHDQLISKNGDYAYMFEVQSHYYKEEVEAI
ncbi:ABC transporter ATP-binding protein [Anaerocolumna sp. MB42-C2]|uniref:ABC transporter ATP-binding protein n=1 Tax=Anaerocolumna sp. MB42-C2 TaxID=3070997 RepID=UPI0027DF19B7|nr:ABC transporter ATP-binding protein [Anaerocolumna sp. MB42-C2]WMJ85527.1 ABC transporter ATP-binding protein [Anaerocolumna sp. MB42-C2]